MLAMYVSWWTLALALGSLACFISAIFFRRLRGSHRLILAGLGVALLAGWISADLIGPGPAIFPDKDPALNPAQRFYVVRGIPYTQHTNDCRTEAAMRGAGDLQGQLIPVGHIVGWFGGPQVFIESGSGPTEPVFVDVGDDCYVLYVTVVG